MTDIT